MTPSASQDSALPSKVLNLAAYKDYGLSMINISWEEPEYSGTSNIINYVIRYKQASDAEFQSLSTIDTSYDLFQADVVASYIIEVYAVNSSGSGLPVSINI